MEKLKPKAITVRLVVIEDDQVLLVHEKGDQFSSKPAGWGLPGGGLDGKNAEELVMSIRRFLPIQSRVPPEQVEAMMFTILDFTTDIALDVFLVGVKEGIEETGLVIRPEKKLFEIQNSPEHTIVVVRGNILGGTLSTRNTETDDCRWFSLETLPQGLYVSHERMIRRTMNILSLSSGTK
ncbi:MAG: hypothetical protein Q7S32_03710 [bacterium]|nr:hypothetical protein [bacterium]